MTELTLTHETPAATATQPEGSFPESTLCLRLDLDGIGLSWTIRGTDDSMSKRLPRILEYIKKLQAKLPKAEPPRPVAVPSAPLEERSDWCPIHQVAMVQNSNDRGSWFSHKTPDGFCKGKRRKAGA